MTSSASASSRPACPRTCRAGRLPLITELWRDGGDNRRMNAMPRWSIPLLAAALAAAPLAAADLEAEVVERVNVERWTYGQLPPLKADTALGNAARGHSQAMGVRNFFAHCDLDTGSQPWDRMTAAGYVGYNAAAENIAAGQSSAAAVVASWMDSPGHRNNILSTQVRELGVGYYLDAADPPGIRTDSNGDCIADGSIGYGLRHYWTQNFGRRADVFPVVIACEAQVVDECLIDIYLYGQGWAQEYRLSNDGQAWSGWQPFTANVLWPLSGSAGATVTVHAQLRNGGQVRSARDSVRLQVDCGASPPDVIFANGFEG